MPRLSRDRITWLIYAQLAMWGYFLYGFGPVVPLLRDEQGTSAAIASLHGTGLAVGGLIAGSTFPILARRLGRERTLWLATAGVALSVAALCLFRPLPATLASTVACSVFGTMLVSGVVTALTGHHGPAASAAISEANAAAAGMGVAAPVVIGLAVGAGLGWRPGLAAVVGLIALLALVAFRFGVRLPHRDSAGAAATETPRGPLPRAYWIAWALMCMTGSVEVCLSLWAADVLRGHAGMSPGAASAALAAIVGGMFVGRLVGGRIALRVAPVPLLLAAFAVSTAGFVVFWFATAGWLAVAGLIVVGLGNAMHYPLAISIAMVAAGGQPDRAAGYANYSVAVGFGIAPVVLGWVADWGGSHLAFLLVPVLLAAAALLAVRLSRALRLAPAESPVAPLPA